MKKISTPAQSPANVATVEAQLEQLNVTISGIEAWMSYMVVRQLGINQIADNTKGEMVNAVRHNGVNLVHL